MAFLASPRPRVLPLSSGSSSGGRRALIAAVTTAVAAAVIVGQQSGTDATNTVSADADLVHLLRLMALLKAAMSAALVGAVWWRLGVVAPGAWLAGYGVACSAAAAGPVLIWTGAHLLAGAVLLHGGLLLGLALLWRDPAVGARLSKAIAAWRIRRR